MKAILVILNLLFAVSCVTTPVEEPTPEPDCVYINKQSTALSSPWKDSGRAIVIDAYEGNPIDWNEMAKDKRVVAVIHRSAQGLRKDREYFKRRTIAKERGYLWGAYHLATPGDVEKQVDLLIEMAGDDLAILDLEDTNSSKFMSLAEAMQFIELYHNKTNGKIPVIYANHATTKLINAKYPNFQKLKSAKFWYARFKSSVTDFPKGVWSGYFLWQFSSEINCSKTGSCPYNVPGTKYDMDVNVFDGNAQDLKAHWNNGCVK